MCPKNSEFVILHFIYSHPLRVENFINHVYKGIEVSADEDAVGQGQKTSIASDKPEDVIK